MGGVKGVVTFDEMHDRELYAFEGDTNIHLEPDPAVRAAAYNAWERGLLTGWLARGDADYAAIVRVHGEGWGTAIESLNVSNAR